MTQLKLKSSGANGIAHQLDSRGEQRVCSCFISVSPGHHRKPTWTNTLMDIIHLNKSSQLIRNRLKHSNRSPTRKNLDRHWLWLYHRNHHFKSVLQYTDSHWLFYQDRSLYPIQRDKKLPSKNGQATSLCDVETCLEPSQNHKELWFWPRNHLQRKDCKRTWQTPWHLTTHVNKIPSQKQCTIRAC